MSRKQEMAAPVSRSVARVCSCQWMGRNGAAAMVLEIWDNWILLGLLAAGGWAMSSVLDVCFVGEGIYGDPVDGPIIAGLFFFFPVVAAARSLGTLGGHSAFNTLRR